MNLRNRYAIVDAGLERKNIDGLINYNGSACQNSSLYAKNGLSGISNFSTRIIQGYHSNQKFIRLNKVNQPQVIAYIFTDIAFSP